MAKPIVAFRNFANAAKTANGALNMQDHWNNTCVWAIGFVGGQDVNT
jgi:hypothetical protein